MKKSLLILTAITSISLQPNLHAISMHTWKQRTSGAAIIGAIIGLIVQNQTSSQPKGWQKYAYYAAAALIGGAAVGGVTGGISYRYTPGPRLNRAQKNLDFAKESQLITDNTLLTEADRQTKAREVYSLSLWPLPTAWEKMGKVWTSLDKVATESNTAATDAQEDNNNEQVVQANRLKADAEGLKNNAQTIRVAVQNDRDYTKQANDRARWLQKQAELALKKKRLDLETSREFHRWTQHSCHHVGYHRHWCPNCHRW